MSPTKRNASPGKSRATDDAQDRTRVKHWTEEQIVAELRRLEQSGVPITIPGLVAAGHKPLAAWMRRFGGLKHYRDRAGIENPVTFGMAADEVLQEIQKRHEKKKPLAMTQVPKSLLSAAVNRFGSWKEAIAAAGLDYDEIRLTRMHSEESLLEMLRTLAKEKPDMTLLELRELIGTTLVQWFGSPSKAAQKAGLKDWPRRLRRENQ